MAEQMHEYQLPRRRDLRLARQRAQMQETAVTEQLHTPLVQAVPASAAQAPDAQVAPDTQSASHTQSVSRDQAVLHGQVANDCVSPARPLETSRPARRTRTGAHVAPSRKASDRKRAFVGAGLGFSCAAAAIGGLSFNHASQAQAAVSHSVLADGLLTSTVRDTPESLQKAPASQAIAQAGSQVKAAQSVATDTAALCAGFDKGADSVASAYVPGDVSLTYMPLHQGSYSLTSPFGMRIHPISGTSEMHNGVDMAGPAGTPMFAVANGRVLTINHYGSNNGIVIEHHVNGKTFTTWYLHSYAEDILVQPGDEVKAGQQISSVGSAGQSTGAHLHFEFHWGAGLNTQAVEPLSALEEIGAMWVGSSCQL